jgi:beta-glucanase (GH16 family)
MNPKNLILALVVGVTLVAHAAPPPGYKLVWADEFKGNALDTNKWIYWLPGRRNDSFNVTNAVSVRGGDVILTTYTEAGRHYTGMISTEGKFAPVHGYWEARVKYTDAVGMWSAFWLQSPTMGRPIGDTAKAGVEIDICEHRFVGDKGESLKSQVQHTLHWDGYGQHHKSKGQLTPPMKLDRGYHIYGCEITTNGYRFFTDGKLTWTVTEAVSNAKEFAILSSEVKDGAWAGAVPAAGYGDLKHSNLKMTVDYVRYYSRE